MEGRKGVRYWVYNPFEITNVKAVNDRYEINIFSCL